MGHRFSEVTFTPSVEGMQKQLGSYEHVAAVRQRMPEFDRFEMREREFIAARDSFYIASVSESGWPYLQHRGGESGFLKVLDNQTLAFVNFSGNGQYQNLGNITQNNRVALFLMDYPNRRRLKILGRANLLAGEQLSDGDRQHLQYGQAELVIRIDLEAFDWNCSQYISPRYTASEMEAFNAIE